MKSVRDLVESKPCWSSENEDILRAPYNHIISKPGKNFRSKLIRLFNLFYSLDEKHIVKIEELVSILHNSSLLIDDIEDSSEVRRGDVAAHVKFGVPMTINSANYMYFVAMNVLKELAELDSTINQQDDAHLLKDLMIVFNEELVNLHRGQGLDIFWRDNLINNVVPDELMYFDMVMNKTGGLFRLTVRIMERLCTLDAYKSGNCSLVPLSNLLGILYQLRDDYQNLVDTKMFAKKGFADDLSEGKLSFPIIHGLKYEQDHQKKTSSDNFNYLLNILLSKPTDEGKKLEAISYLRDTSKSLEYTEKKIASVTQLIKDGNYIPNHDQKISSQILLIVDQLATVS